MLFTHNYIPHFRYFPKSLWLQAHHVQSKLRSFQIPFPKDAYKVNLEIVPIFIKNEKFEDWILHTSSSSKFTVCWKPKPLLFSMVKNHEEHRRSSYILLCALSNPIHLSKSVHIHYQPIYCPLITGCPKKDRL